MKMLTALGSETGWFSTPGFDPDRSLEPLLDDGFAFEIRFATLTPL
jgi:hypothetical protein